MKTCRLCGAAFRVVAHGGAKVYCSSKCRREDRRLREGGSQKQERPCGSCGKPFIANARNFKYCSDVCRVRQQSAAVRMGGARAFNLWYKYGVTLARYDEMLTAQGGVCAICKKPPEIGKVLHVDHDHKTGKVRGLLCAPCNLALGRYEARKNGMDAYLDKQR